MMNLMMNTIIITKVVVVQYKFEMTHMTGTFLCNTVTDRQTYIHTQRQTYACFSLSIDIKTILYRLKQTGTNTHTQTDRQIERVKEIGQ